MKHMKQFWETKELRKSGKLIVFLWFFKHWTPIKKLSTSDFYGIWFLDIRFHAQTFHPTKNLPSLTEHF